jgi:hypothetical protein
LKSAKSGEIIFVKETANINMTGVYGTSIPSGVTIASNRGSSGSLGGRIFQNRLSTDPSGSAWNLVDASMLMVTGNNVRITGLRIEGPDKTTDPLSGKTKIGIFNYGKEGLEIDNNEIFGWSESGVSVRNDNTTAELKGLAAPEIGSTITYVHHNYIHHCQANSEGYGVVVVLGSALIKANLFDYCRHAIADTGYNLNGYEATYNVYLTHELLGHIFDVHGKPADGGTAGNTYRFDHNTILSNYTHSIVIRGKPLNKATITNNILTNCVGICFSYHYRPGGPQNAVIQYHSSGNITMFDNLIDGVYFGTAQIYYV